MNRPFFVEDNDGFRAMIDLDHVVDVYEADDDEHGKVVVITTSIGMEHSTYTTKGDFMDVCLSIQSGYSRVQDGLATAKRVA